MWVNFCDFFSIFFFFLNLGNRITCMTFAVNALIIIQAAPYKGKPALGAAYIDDNSLTQSIKLAKYVL
jgi:hypothetical protein